MNDLQFVKGLRDLGLRMRQLPVDLQRKVLRKAVVAGARVVKEAAQRAAVPPIPPISATVGRRKKRAPSGALTRAALIKFAAEKSNDTQIDYIVTFRRGKRAAKSGADAFYAPFVERGHRIVSRGPRASTLAGALRNKRKLSARRAAARASGARVPAHPFFGPAFAASRQRALDAIVASLKQSIPAELGR